MAPRRYWEHPSFGFVPPIMAAMLVAACGSGVQPSSLTLPPALTPAKSPPVVGSSTELYSRIARGAMACWFSPHGPLKRDYIYNADAKSEAEGGTAEILIHVRDNSVQNPRGVKAFRVLLAPASSPNTANLDIENLKMPEQLGAQMKQDVRRWSSGEVGCDAPMAGTHWMPRSADEPAPAVPAKGKAKPTRKATQKNI